MQKLVGGHIQAIYPFEDNVALLCNEDAHLLSLPFNRGVGRGYGAVFGTFLICGLGEEAFCSLTPAQIENYKKVFYQAEILVGVKGNSAIVKFAKPKAKKTPARNKGRSAPGHDR